MHTTFCQNPTPCFLHKASVGTELRHYKALPVRMYLKDCTWNWIFFALLEIETLESAKKRSTALYELQFLQQHTVSVFSWFQREDFRAREKTKFAISDQAAYRDGSLTISSLAPIDALHHHVDGLSVAVMKTVNTAKTTPNPSKAPPPPDINFRRLQALMNRSANLDQLLGRIYPQGLSQLANLRPLVHCMHLLFWSALLREVAVVITITMQWLLYCRHEGNPHRQDYSSSQQSAIIFLRHRFWSAASSGGQKC